MPEETLAEFTKRRRLQLNMTQEDLGDATGMSQRWVSNLEGGGVAQPKTATLSKLSRALDVEVSELVMRLGYAFQEQEAKRLSAVLTVDPDSPEAQLLPYIRAIEWTDRDLKMIKRQLEFLAETKRGEHDR